MISIALLITVLPALVSADSNETIVIGNTVANPDSSFSLPIFVKNVTNMNSLSMDLIFDSSLLSVDSIVANDTLSGSELTYYLNNSTGFANMTLSSVDVTAEEQFHVADILFSALASGYSDIIAENVSLENNTMLYPALFVFNGSVRVNHLPKIDYIADKTVNEGSELSFSVSASDVDDYALSYNVEGLPSGYDFNSTTGFFMWTPAIGDSDIYYANFSVSDGFAVDFTHANITVNEAILDQPPELSAIGNKNVDEDSLLSFTISAIDPDGDIVSYSYSSSTLPDSASLDSRTGFFSWTPGYDDAGIYEVEFTATANNVPDSETIIITVGGVDRAPELSAIGNKNVDEDSLLSFTISAIDPDGDIVSYSYSSSTLPDSASLDSRTGFFSWTPGYDGAGIYEVEFTATANGVPDSETIIITVGGVDRAPELSAIGNKNVDEDSLLSFTISAIDPDGDIVSYSYSSSTLPDSASLDSRTGFFSWTPGYDDAGIYEVEFTATANGVPDSETIIITVGGVDRAPELSAIGNKNVDEDSLLSFTISAIDPDGDIVSYSYSSSTLPDSASLDSRTGFFSWTPGYDGAGIYEVEFTATANGVPDSETIIITVGGVDRAPELSAIGNKNVDEDSLLSFTISAIDPDGDIVSYSYSSSTLPDSASLDSRTGFFSWTPGYDDAGIYEVEFTATANGVPDSETIIITVGGVDRAPELSAIGNKNVDEDSLLSFTISAIDPDGDIVSYSYSSSTLPDSASLDSRTGFFSWTPGYDDAGIYEVEFTATANGVPDSETIIITVGGVDRAPELSAIGNKNVDEDSLLSFTISAIDPDGDIVSYSYSSSTLPDSASLDSRTGFFSWTPGYDGAGIYEVEFTATANGVPDSETIIITVGGVDRAPELSAIGNKNVDEGSLLSFTISAIDPDGDIVSYSYSSSTLPDSASLDSRTGFFSWTPGYDDAGIYEVEFTATANGVPDSETIIITVGGVDRAPELSAIGNKNVDEGSLLSFTISAIDPDGDIVSYSYSSSTLPDSASLDSRTGFFSWTPGYDGAGIYEVEFTATANGVPDSEIININVVDVNREPILMVIGPQSVDENKPLTITPVATDDDDDTLYYSVVDSPSGSEIDESTGIFTWTPTYEQDGRYLIRFVVSDGQLEDTENVTVTVNDVNRPPVLNIQEPINVPENSTLILDLNASDPDDDILEYSKDVSFGTLQEDVFSWKPGYEDEGAYSVTFTVSDAEFKVSKTLTINVTHTNSPPVINFTSLILVNELETVTINLTAVDIDDDELEFSKDVEYGSISGNIFTWIPGINDNDIHKILFTVSDGQLSDSKLAIIAVGNTNIPPVIIHTGIQQVRENEMLTFTLNASDVDNDTLTYSCSELPAGANIESTNGTFTWTPTYEQAGTYTVELMVSDGIYPAVDAVVIKVENVNRAPVFDSIPTHTVNETETLVIHLDASDPDGDSMTFSTTAKNGKVIGNTFTWTPGYYDSGDYDLDFKVTDGYLTDNTTVHVEVYQTNMPPKIEYMGSYSVYENNTLQFFVEATDGDNDSLTYSVSGLPKGASFNTSTGQFTWKPSYTQSGTYSVEFQVTDGELNASEAVSIRVYDVDLRNIADFSGFETSSSGSSGGGSSSGAEDYDNVAYKDYSIKYVTQGMDIVFEFPNAENDLEYVKFHAVKAAGQVKAIIEILKERSTLVSSNPPGDVYRNINIWVGDAKFNSAGYMSSAEISFKVEKKWLTDNNADPSYIRLYRYSGGSWNELKTSRIGMDAKYYYYKAQTPGFSPFSIVSTGSIPVSVNTAVKSTVENVQYSYDADTRLESTESDSEAAIMNTALEPRSAHPVDIGIVFMGIIGIITIGSVLGYKSRNESVVLSRYYNVLYAVSASVRNAAKWPMYKLSSDSMHKDYTVISEKLKTIRSADYRILCQKKITEIKERQKQ
ncbi:putative Ig domain-containing protein [Methanolobus mangrovi]|uniref:Ig domain-containing protein n=1 Tax=Methanolobus mangrovi TaxID=3072977 RepID=A0AA51UDN5_9EURY|nr:putative Ig domain-containing protein [Methanolobus mangrovi]WMW21265.1 putative Ig domain-containing protein [Methanolobus mangrovi]